MESSVLECVCVCVRACKYVCVSVCVCVDVHACVLNTYMFDVPLSDV